MKHCGGNEKVDKNNENKDLTNTYTQNYHFQKKRLTNSPLL